MGRGTTEKIKRRNIEENKYERKKKTVRKIQRGVGVGYNKMGSKVRLGHIRGRAKKKYLPSFYL